MHDELAFAAAAAALDKVDLLVLCYIAVHVAEFVFVMSKLVV